MRFSQWIALLLLLMALLGCSREQATPTGEATPAPLPASPTPAGEASPTEGVASPLPTEAEAPPSTLVLPTAPPDPATQPEESILISEPGPGSRLTSPLRVVGLADPTFEQNLVVRLLLADGSELALQPTTIQSDIGTRGPFEIELAFSVAEEQQGFIQVFADSARDGGITHLTSVGVTLAPSGEATIQPAPDSREAIAISAPTRGATVSGGTVHIEGIGRAGFENTLVVDVLDGDGNTLARQAITVSAPEMGQFGPFSVDLPYTVGASGPGRIVVRDVSPAFGGTSHLSSVEVTLAP